MKTNLIIHLPKAYNQECQGCYPRPQVYPPDGPQVNPFDLVQMGHAPQGLHGTVQMRNLWNQQAFAPGYRGMEPTLQRPPTPGPVEPGPSVGEQLGVQGAAIPVWTRPNQPSSTSYLREILQGTFTKYTVTRRSEPEPPSWQPSPQSPITEDSSDDTPEEIAAGLNYRGSPPPYPKGYEWPQQSQGDVLSNQEPTAANVTDCGEYSPHTPPGPPPPIDDNIA